MDGGKEQPSFTQQEISILVLLFVVFGVFIGSSISYYKYNQLKILKNKIMEEWQFQNQIESLNDKIKNNE